MLLSRSEGPEWSESEEKVSKIARPAADVRP